MKAEEWQSHLASAAVLFEGVAHLARWRDDPGGDAFMSREDWVLLQGADTHVFDRMDASDGRQDSRVSLDEFKAWLTSLRVEKGKAGEEEVVELLKSSQTQLSTLKTHKGSDLPTLPIPMQPSLS